MTPEPVHLPARDGDGERLGYCDACYQDWPCADDDSGCRQWTLILPMTRPLSMNDRSHWRKKAHSTKEVRVAARVLARSLSIPPLPRVSIELHYAPRDKRRRDAINLAATVKPIEDGIVDAGVVPDDTAEYVEPTHAVIDPPTGGRAGRLYVVVRELSAYDPPDAA